MYKAKSIADAYIPGIDGLRAIAVISVIIFHLNEDWLPGGFIGVDIFFVISGYVISKSLAIHDHSSFWPYILQFYRRRLLRILPALIFVLFISSIVSTIFIPRAWLSAANEGTAFWAFLGLSNFHLLTTADGYFNDRIIFNPFVHTWSLAVEEQFYLIFPLLFFFWTLPGKSNSFLARAKLMLLPLLVLFSLLYSIFETSAYPDRAFYLLQSRFWELGAGTLIFLLQAHGRLEFSNKVKQMLFLFGLMLISISFVVVDQNSFPFPWAIPPILGTALIISSFSDRPQTYQVQGLLEINWMRFIGRISYSLYLWHWPVYTFFRWTVGLEGTVHIVIACSLTFIFAIMSYYLIETPFRRWRFIKLIDSRIIVALSCILIAVSMFSVSKLFYYGNWRLNSSVTADNCTWNAAYRSNCHEHVPKSNSKDKVRNLIVSGDSHAGAYSTMVNLAANELNLNLIWINRSGCPVFNLRSPMAEGSRCSDFVTGLKERIFDVAKSGDILFLPSLRVPRFSDQWGLKDQSNIHKWQEANGESPRQLAALEEARNFITEIQDHGIIVIFDAPKPVFSAPAFRCSDWFNRDNPVCEPGFEKTREEMLIHRSPAMKQINKLKLSNEIEIWDALPYLCDQRNCSAFRNNKPLFMDQDHLSGYGNTVLFPHFVKFLEQILTEKS